MDSAASPRVTKLGFDMPASLLVTWHDGSRSRHDLSPLIASKKWAAPLAADTVFRSAVLEDDGWQSVWPGTDTAFSPGGDGEGRPPPTSPPAQGTAGRELTRWRRAVGEVLGPDATRAPWGWFGGALRDYAASERAALLMRTLV